MAFSPVSNRVSSFRAPSQNAANRPEGVSSAHARGGRCGASGANAASDFQKDSFSAGPQKGAQWQQFMQGLNEVVKELEQLTQMIQNKAGGAGSSPAAGGVQGAGGASGAPSTEGAQSAGGAPSTEGAQSAGGAPSTGDTSEAGAAASSGSAGEAPKGQVGDWIKQAQELLKAAGVPADKMNAQDIATIIQHESSGDPNAVNNWDDNAKAGHPSIGLMQTIQSTFDAYKLPGHDNIRDPVDNIVAAVRYAVERYGSVSKVPGVQGLNGGGGYVGY